MKFKELTTEHQKHFLNVVEFCKENGLEEQLEEATHIDFKVVRSSLTKSEADGESFYAENLGCWLDILNNRSELYQKPEDYQYLLEEPNNNTSETSTWNWEDLRGKTVEVCVDKEGMVILKDDYGYFYVVKCS